MSQLTPEKLTEIAALIERSSPQMAARLLAMFERVKVKGAEAVPTEALLQAVRDSGHVLPASVERMPGLDRLFFEPFEGLFEPDTGAPMMPGAIPRQSLAPAWAAIAGEIAPDRVRILDPMARSAVLRGDRAAAQRYAAELRDAVLASAEEWMPEGPAKDAGFRARCRALLGAEKALRPLIDQAFQPTGDLTDASVTPLAMALCAAEANGAQNAAEFALILMSRTRKPWQVLRVLGRASRGVSDRRLAETEFEVVGLRLLEMVRRDAAEVERASQGDHFDAALLTAAVDRMSKLVSGIEREAVMSADGPWRRELFAIKGRTADRLVTICQRAGALIETVLPLDRTRVRGAGWVDLPRLRSDPRLDRLPLAHCHLEFLNRVRLFAPLAGIGGARDKAARDVLAHLDMVRNGLISQRSSPDRGPHYDAWVHATADLVRALEDDEAARLFEKRAVA